MVEIRITRNPSSRIGEVDFNNIVFGKEFSDHMFICDYDGKQWTEPRIVPYGNLSLSPALSAIHYGQSIFEGMKAFKGPGGEPLLFRPEDNWARLNHSAERMCMPTIPKDIFMKGLETLVSMERDWIPSKTGSALYIRPFMFATDDFLGVRPSEKYSFMIYCCPVNAYYTTPLNVKVEDKYSRAAPGGTGSTKCAGNYGASMLPTKLAKDEGYDQVLWTDASTHSFIEETGTTNCFVVIGDTVLTPALGDTLLSGITRDSVIKVLIHLGIAVEERPVSVDELLTAAQNGTLREMFVTGTAATIVNVISLGYKGQNYKLPELSENNISNTVLRTIEDIRTRKTADPFGWVAEAEKTVTAV